MMLFCTNSVQHLARNINIAQGKVTIKKFSDGECFVRIESNVKNKQVWVLTATQAPAENLIELFFLLDALQRSGATIFLCITYFAYARQLLVAPGESRSAEVISNILNTFSISKLYIMHPHNKLLHTLLPFTAIYDIDFFCKHVEKYDAVAAPDAGAYKFASEIAKKCGKELVALNKIRPEHEQVLITSMDGIIKNKRIALVDDMISTGRTLVEAAYALKKQGALAIAAVATHGVFAPGSIERLEQSSLEKITVTNSIVHPALGGKISIDDISCFIQTIMREV